MKKQLLLICLSAILLSSGFSMAENNDDSETSSRLHEVVVTATRSDQDVKKVPANVTVITEKDIQKSNAKVVADLLRAEQGIVVRDLLGNGKSAQVDLRGFGETGPYNTLVMVDGRRVNSIDLSGTDWTQIPIDQVERIEIVRGTGSVLYGDNAVGGVINIITKAPSKVIKVKGKATFGSYSRDQQEAYISGGYKALSGSVFASQDSTDGYRHDNEFKAWDVGGNFFFDPTDVISFYINGSYHEDEFDLPGPLTYLQQKANRKGNNNPYDKAKTKDYYVTSGFDLDLGKYGNLIADVSYRNQKNSAEYPETAPAWSNARDIENETWSLTPRYVWSGEIFGYKNTLIAGVDFYWGDMELDAYSQTPLVPSDTADISRDSVGFYFNNEFSILKNLLVSLGARHESVEYDAYQEDLLFGLNSLDDKSKESENAYSAGLTYLYRGDSAIFARVNRSFRFPLVDELIFQDWMLFEIRLNPDLKPQTGIHYETGIRHYFTPDIRANITYFRAEIEDEIYYNPGTFMNENHPETLHQGVELGAYADLFDFLTLFGNYTYEEATFEAHPYEHNDIPAVPRHKGSVGFEIHDIIIPGLIFSTDCHYVGSSYAISDQANDFDEKDSYYTINTMLSYEWEMLKLFFGINNLTNKKYSEYAVMDTFLTQRYFYPAPERNYFGGISLEF